MIPRIKKILYATDLSENASYAFGYAVCLANRHDAKITVLHVVEELSFFAQSMIEDIVGAQQLKTMRKEKEEKVIASIKDRLDDFCEGAKRESPNCPFVVEKTMVKTGHPVDQIVRRAEEMEADIIVMGSRGHGMLADVTMGSTSRRVLRRCKKPVLIVRLPEEIGR